MEGSSNDNKDNIDEQKVNYVKEEEDGNNNAELIAGKDQTNTQEVIVNGDGGNREMTIGEEILHEQIVEDMQKEKIASERNKGPHLYREAKTSIDDGTFAVFNRFRDQKKLPLQKMMSNSIYDGLHKLVKDGKLKKIKKLLGKVGHASVDLRTEKQFYNRTALHIACICGNLEVVQLLLGHKANKNLQDNWGWTPIMYAGSYGHVSIVKELIGRGANISLKNKKGQFLIDIVRAKRDEFEWRNDLVSFIEKTENDLTSQMFADGLQTMFGRILHATRPKPRYRDATLTLPLNERDLYLEHRNGDFGFQHCKRFYSLKYLSNAQILPGSKDEKIEFCLEKSTREEVFLQDRPNQEVQHLQTDKDKISKTDLNQIISLHVDVPSKIHASWMLRYLKSRVENYDNYMISTKKNKSKLNFKMLKNTFKFANTLKKKNNKK